MADRNHQWVELLKYPVLVFSVVVALIVLKSTLDIEFGAVTELSTEGLKFSEKSNQATLEAITELESKLNDLTVRIESIEQRPDAGEGPVQETRLQAFSASQTVSDATATIAKLSPGIPGQEAEKLVGWMWIGDYGTEWSKTPLARLDTGQPITLAPDQMRVGTEYKVLGNMVVRDGLPPNDQDYYRARKSLGVVPRGNTISILSRPTGIDREFAVQYWAKVEYLKGDKS